MTSKKFSSVVVALVGIMAVAMMAAPVEAGSINLNDVYNAGNPFMSDNYMWIDVVETNGPVDEPAFNYYQDPITLGDSLIVNPTNFRVDVTPGPELQQIDSQLELVIMGKNGNAVPMINFMEEGDYEVNGLSMSEAFVSATVSYFYQVLEGSSAGQSGSGTVGFGASAAPNDSGLWDLNFDVMMPAGATKVRFEFDNRLVAQATTDLSSAFIAKKTIPGIKVSVPEPSAILIALLGALVSLMGVRR